LRLPTTFLVPHEPLAPLWVAQLAEPSTVTVFVCALSHHALAYHNGADADAENADGTAAVLCCGAAANSFLPEGYDDPRLGALFVDRWVRTPDLYSSHHNGLFPQHKRHCSTAALPTHLSKLVVDPISCTSHPVPPCSKTLFGVVCRVLSGARAVQVLGRINRPAPHKEGCLLVVDFVNSAGAIREAFGEYYGTTSFCTGEGLGG